MSDVTLLDEKEPILLDSSSNLYLIEEVRNAKVVASVVEKLYGKRYTVKEVMRENQIYHLQAKRDEEKLLHP